MDLTYLRNMVCKVLYDPRLQEYVGAPEHGYLAVAQNTGFNTWGERRPSLPRCSYSMMLD